MNVKFIDPGFSDMHADDISFLGKGYWKNFVLNALNTETRLDVRVIDDAYSLLAVAKYISPDLISDNYPLWVKFNDQCGRHVWNAKGW